MNLLFSLLLSVLSGHLTGFVKCDGLIAVSVGSSVRTLYKRSVEADFMSPKPDRAYTDANFRKSICDEITGSRYFPTEGMFPVNMEPDALSKKLRNNEIFSRIYTTIPQQCDDSSVLNKLPTFLSSGKQKPKFEYQNLFAPREFVFYEFYGRTTEILEDVFVCLLENMEDDEVYPYYVTKEYNVNGEPFRAGRFIFTERRGSVSSDPFYSMLLLAEAPAKVFEEPENPKYDIELKYLERRQDLPLAPDKASDPICKLLPEFGPDNYGSRLCALVMSSSDFQRTTIQYVEFWDLPKCVEITVSFNSAEAKKIVGENVYRERALRCQCRESTTLKYLRDHVYITRAYAPNEVFVFQYDFGNGKIFLKNLTVDVGLVRGGATV